VKSRPTSIPKKKILIIGILLIVVVAAITFFIVQSQTTPQNANLKSQKGMIELQQLAANKLLKNGDSISGKFKPQADANLYYIVSTEDKKVLGLGSISPGKDNHFSRNLNINTSGQIQKKGELKVYLQGKDGQAIDSVTTKITLE